MDGDADDAGLVAFLEALEELEVGAVGGIGGRDEREEEDIHVVGLELLEGGVEVGLGHAPEFEPEEHLLAAAGEGLGGAVEGAVGQGGVDEVDAGVEAGLVDVGLDAPAAHAEGGHLEPGAPQAAHLLARAPRDDDPGGERRGAGCEEVTAGQARRASVVAAI